MAETRSLFARERGIGRVERKAGPVMNLEIREKTPQELSICHTASSINSAQTGFPEPIQLIAPLQPTESAKIDINLQEISEIDRENHQKIKEMTSEEIKTAKSEIESLLTPSQIAFLRKRGADKVNSKSKNRHMDTEVTPESVETAISELTSTSFATCMVQNTPPSHSEDGVKYDLEGNAVQYYRDGKWTESEVQGYTITEMVRLARSIVPAQRVVGLQMMGRVVRNRGAMGLNHMIRDCGLLVVLRSALDDSALSVLLTSLTTLCSITTHDLPSDLAIQQFDRLLYPRIQSISNNALLSNTARSSPEFIEELTVKHDHSPDNEETEDDNDLSCTDFLGTMIKTGLLMRISYLITTHTQGRVNVEMVAEVILACAMHSVSGAFAVVRTPGLIEHICGKLWAAETTVVRILTVLSAASHSISITILKHREMWVGHLNQGLLELYDATDFALSSWDLFDQLLRYGIDVIPFEAFLAAISEFIGKIRHNVSEKQGKLIGKIYTVLARREKGRIGNSEGYLELARAFLQVCMENNYLSLPYKHAFIGIFRYLLSSEKMMLGVSFIGPWLREILSKPFELGPFSHYYLLDTVYSSSLPRLNLYLNHHFWEENSLISIKFLSLVIKFATCLHLPDLHFSHILPQITVFLSQCIHLTSRDSLPNILTYRLHDLALLVISILQYMDVNGEIHSEMAVKTAHLTVVLLGQYAEIYVNYVISKWLFEGEKAILEYFLGFLSSVEHLKRSENLILQETKLTSYTLCLSENRFLPIKIDYLYQLLREKPSKEVISLLLNLENSNFIDYCPVHKKIAAINDFLQNCDFAESDKNLHLLLNLIANNENFAVNLGEIKENVFGYLRFYIADSYCSEVLSRWMAVFLRPEVEEGIRKYACQELEMLFVRMAASIGTDVFGSPDRYLRVETSPFILDFYRYVQPQLPSPLFYSRVISQALASP